MPRIASILLQACVFFLPWCLRRRMLAVFFSWQLHPDCRIGFSLVLSSSVSLAKGSRIGSFTVVKDLDCLCLKEHARIGKWNLITAYKGKSDSFSHITGRSRSLEIGAHSAITMRHIIDCNESVVVGRFSTIAGYRSQLLTHSIDIYNCRQHAEPIKIGDFCFIGTGCILLGGAELPSYCVLGAGSVLTSRFTTENALYAGTPAVHKKMFDDNVAYFTRSVGSVI